MISYLQKQKEAHRLLNNALENAKKAIAPERDGEENIFEERSRARQNLDNLAENTSLEARQAYQAINKQDKVAACIEKLAEKIWNHLKTYEERSDDQSNTEFLKILNERGYKKNT